MPTYTTDQRSLMTSQLLDVSRETVAEYLAALPADALADLDLILEQAAKVRFSSAKFKGEGVESDPEEKRVVLRQQARSTIGMAEVLGRIGFTVL